MPDATIASAVSRMSCSLISQWNLFQLFHPIGGAGASPSSVRPDVADPPGPGGLRGPGGAGRDAAGEHARVSAAVSTVARARRPGMACLRARGAVPNSGLDRESVDGSRAVFLAGAQDDRRKVGLVRRVGEV